MKVSATTTPPKETPSRRRQILLAAGRVFVNSGFRRATMEEIADAAHVGIGTLYHYFESKEHLCASLEAESELLLHARLKAAAAKQLPPTFAMLAIARAYVSHLAEHPEFFRIRALFRYEPEVARARPDAERRKIARLARRNLDIIAGKVREGQRLGLFRPNLDPLAVAVTLSASFLGVMIAVGNPGLLEVADLDVETLVSMAAFLQSVGLNTDESVPPTTPVRRSRRENVSVADLQDVLRSARWITPRMVFSGMKVLFQPQKTRGIRERYVYRIDGPQGGVWSIGIEDGALAIIEGPCESPDATFEIADQDFIRLVTGEAESMDLVATGHLKISGDLRCVARLPSYFRPDSSPVDAAPARTMPKRRAERRSVDAES